MFFLALLAYLASSVVYSTTNNNLFDRISQVSKPGDSYQREQDYHNRSRHANLFKNRTLTNNIIHTPRLHKLFGVKSLTLRKSPSNLRGISYQTESVEKPFVHLWAPRRSTIAPLKTQTETPSYHSSVNSIHTVDGLTISHQGKSKLHLKKQQVTKGVKGFAPAEVDKEAAQLLEKVLRNERAKLRHNIIIRKIEETKKNIDDLEEYNKNESTVVHRKKKKNYKKKTPENIARKVLQTQLAIQKKLAEADQLKYMIKDGVLFREGNIPIAKVSAQPPDSRMFSFNTVHATEQTKVQSSSIVIEGTTTVPTMATIDRSTTNLLSKNVSPLIPIPNNSIISNIRSSTIDKPTKGFSKAHPQSLEIKPFFPEKEKFLDSSKELGNDLIEETKTPPPYPFSHCYMNVDGYMCCSRYLESLIRKSYKQLKETKRFNDCSIQKIANKLQKDAQDVFNTTFEAIVALDDFALRAHFAGDLMCKLIEDGHFVTLYATAMPNRAGSKEDPLHVVTPLAIDVKDTENTSVNVRNRILESSPDPIRRSTGLKIPFHEMSREDIDNELLLFTDINNEI